MFKQLFFVNYRCSVSRQKSVMADYDDKIQFSVLPMSIVMERKKGNK